MFADILFPEALKPIELDKFLANGWFRMGQAVFTTHFLCFKNVFYSAIWLRVNLSDTVDDVKFRRLQKQNQGFRIEIKTAAITPQHEALYSNYKQSISFEPSQTLQALLYGFITGNRFNTYEANVYDGDLLIATGFFDLGKESAAGIVSFYHPDYKKFSLGKYLIYLKMEFCRHQSLQYFYPGYVVPGYPPFDYKVTIGTSALQYFAVSSQQWLPYSSFTAYADPLGVMYHHLTVLQNYLHSRKIGSQLLYYRFFDANLDPYYVSEGLFDFPVFLQCTPATDDTSFRLIVYDVINAKFCLVGCSSVIKTDWYTHVKDTFSSDLLKLDKRLYSDATPEKLAAYLLTDKRGKAN